MKLVLFVFVILMLWTTGCASMTKLGITYQTAYGNVVDVSLIQSNQIDAAWITAVDIWGYADPHDVIILFWDKPIQFGSEQLAGATWGTQVNIYLKSVDDSCLFANDTSGTLLHELGHSILYAQRNEHPDGDPLHTDPRWHAVDAQRAKLQVTFCQP